PRSRPLPPFPTRRSSDLLLIVVAALAAHRGAPAAGRIRDRLVTQVQARNAALAALQSRLDDARAEAAVLEQAALASSSTGARLSARLGVEELAAGTVAVHGPGLQVRLDDDPGGANH